MASMTGKTLAMWGVVHASIVTMMILLRMGQAHAIEGGASGPFYRLPGVGSLRHPAPVGTPRDRLLRA